MIFNNRYHIAGGPGEAGLHTDHPGAEGGVGILLLDILLDVLGFSTQLVFGICAQACLGYNSMYRSHRCTDRQTVAIQISSVHTR